LHYIGETNQKYQWFIVFILYKIVQTTQPKYQSFRQEMHHVIIAQIETSEGDAVKSMQCACYAGILNLLSCAIYLVDNKKHYFML